MGKRRTPAEMIADLDEKLERLHRRHAIDVAKESPELQELVRHFETVEEQVKKASILSGDGPQGFDYRRMGKKLWLDEIDAQERLNVALMADGEGLVNALRDSIGDLAKKLANGIDCQDEIAETTAAAMSFQSEEMEDLFRIYNDAKTARMLHSEARNLTR